MSKEDFVGAWRLLAVESRDGRGGAFVRVDDGRMHFTGSGHFAAMSVRRSRPRFSSPAPAEATAEEVRQAFDAFVASFGVFDVDEREGVLILHVAGALFPNWEGSAQRRLYTFEGDRVHLRTVPGTFADPNAYAVLSWERLD